MTPETMPSASPVERGFYVDLRKTGDGNLEIRLNRMGRRHFANIREQGDTFGTNAALFALLEDHLCGGWKWSRLRTSGH